VLNVQCKRILLLRVKRLIILEQECYIWLAGECHSSVVVIHSFVCLFVITVIYTVYFYHFYIFYYRELIYFSFLGRPFKLGLVD